MRQDTVWLLALGQTLTYAGAYYAFPALLPDLQAATGWSVAELAAGPTLAFLVMAVLMPLTGRLGLLGLPVLSDCPEIEVEFIESEADPFDPGELGVAAVVPAIANALFSATGLRLRRLPLLSGGL